MKARTTPPTYRSQAAPRPPAAPKKKRTSIKAIMALLLLPLIVGVSVYVGSRGSSADNAAKKTASSKTGGTTTTATTPAPAPVNNCAGNTLTKLIIVSVGQRHEWA